MREQKIEIEIDEHGRIKADAHGFVGDACIKDIEKILANCPGAWMRIDRKPDDKTSKTKTVADNQLKNRGRS